MSYNHYLLVFIQPLASALSLHHVLYLTSVIVIDRRWVSYNHYLLIGGGCHTIITY